MSADKKRVKELQKVIDRFRNQGIEILVEHCGDYNGEPETQISIKFGPKYDAFDIGVQLQKITGPCDTGAGFGYRDLQLCSYWPGLK